MILYHYAPSPYSEKIRLMLGYAGLDWQGVTVPAQPPRPQLDPLAGGYRRIPVAQDGADLFCDSRLISAEIAARANLPALDPGNCNEAGLGFTHSIEGEVFFACVASIPPARVLRQLVKLFGLVGAFRFVRDRGAMAKAAASPPPSPQQAKVIFNRHLEELNRYLDTGGPFISGEAPSHLDFAAYHTYWFHRVVGELPTPEGIPALDAWYHRMGEFGHGRHREIDAAEAHAAVAAGPRPVNEAQAAGEGVGETVAVGPADYGLDAVEGVLVGSDEQRYIVARDTAHGRVHVHFPREGFSLR